MPVLFPVPASLVRIGRVMLVELLRAIRPFEIMALARNTGQGNGHQQQGE